MAPSKVASERSSTEEKLTLKKTENEESGLLAAFRGGNPKLWWAIYSALLIATVVSRFYVLDQPDHVCWDETHFGKFGGYYINRTFFFDVHPPLGKMLVGLFGYLSGYDAKFAFEKPGDKYGDTHYMGMRIGCTAMGAFLVPFSFLTVWEMTFSLPAATFAGLMILLDHGLLTLNRYILLDPILLFFISGTIYTTVKFHNQRDRPFSVSWWFWLAVTGILMTGAISVKFVGLFIIVLVGFRAIRDLWDILGDLSRPVTYTLKHFVARALCLILLPALIYLGVFYIHLRVLYLTGPGDGFFSSAFQTHLEGNSLHNASTPREVAYGSILTLKNSVTGGGYLHSHIHLYPAGVGARQQQITTYTHKDGNNQWIIKRFNKPAPSLFDETIEIDLVKSGDLVRLEHRPTGRNLHSHKEPAPMSKKHFQVTGYGENGTGDANDVWRIVVASGKEGDIIETVRSRFKLVHYLQNCVLTTTKKQLPKWGFDQQEVTCNPNIRDDNAFWNVEDNKFPRLPNITFTTYSLNYLQRFIESHAVMFSGNAGLKPKEGEQTSRPWMWPINLRGQYFSGGDIRIYLLGNPFIWWGNLLFMAFYLFLWSVQAIRDKRGAYTTPRQRELQNRALHASGWLYVGWLLHYVPFWTMGRILYYHHYFPALLFSTMLSAVILDYLFESAVTFLPRHLSNTAYHTLLGGLLALLFYSFYLFSPLVYGANSAPSTEKNSTMYGLRWLDTWEF